LAHLDRILLHSPPLAAGWNTFMGSVRSDLTIDSRLAELAICLIAVLNEAPYELAHHRPEYAAAGATDGQLDALPHLLSPDADLDMFDPTEQTVIALTRELTANGRLTDAMFEQANRYFPEPRQIVELVGVVASYNMVSRFLNAFDIEPE